MSQLQSQLKHNALFELDTYGLLRVSGNKPEAFLQGQLTCDMNLVSSSKIQPAALCNLQGRVLALLDVVQWRGLELVFPKSLIPSVKKTLSKVALVSRVGLEEPAEIGIYGFYLANKSEQTPLGLPLPENIFEQGNTEEACIYSLGQSFYMVLVVKEQRASLEAPFLKEKQLYDASLWHSLQLQRMHFEIYPETEAQLLPHRIGLHKSGHISFNKGCYRGQEIIARTQFRAKIKHGLALFLVESDNLRLRPGLKVFSAANEAVELGELVDFCSYSDKENLFLVLLSILFEHPSEVVFEGNAVSTVIVSVYN